jgi:hypothetical protein
MATGALAAGAMVCGSIFVKSDDPALLAKAHHDLGYRAAFAPNDLSVTETERLAGLIRECASIRIREKRRRPELSWACGPPR